MENIDVLDEMGNKTGEVKSREEVHQKGLWHKTVHMYVINNKKEILMQKRSPEKETNPNKWTTSASGHLSAGDESREGALRELREEIGVEISDKELEYLCTVKEKNGYKNIVNHEIVDVYIVRKDLNIEDLKLQKEEVSAVRWLTLDEFKSETEDCEKNNLVPHIEIFQKVIEYLDKE